MNDGKNIIVTCDVSIKQVLDVMRLHLADSTPEERVLIFDFLAEGYCLHCGDAVTNRCHCENDE